ncbi:general secretion pathway protein GspK [Lichenicola sp.]|uniref:general secretion pathway protein GspK n=1 Tax=Lichenicola sp. TaxID=2804529 RepID=UPI003AFFA3AD
MRGRRDRGFALLIVLWTLVLVSLLVSAIAASGSGRTRQAADLERNAQLQAEADGAVDEAVFHVIDASKAHWPANGSTHLVRRGGTVLSIRIENQAGKVNPNRASLDLLAALFQAIGLDSRSAVTIATRMIVWRFPTAQPVGQSAPPAQAAGGRDYLPPNAPFESISELGLVDGITPALLARLEPHISLYHDNDPDPAFADPVVRQAIALANGPGDAGSSAAPDDNAPPGQAQGSAPDESVVEVTAEARDGSGHRFVRRAIVLIGTNSTGPGAADQRPFQVMTWEAPAAGAPKT